MLRGPDQTSNPTAGFGGAERGGRGPGGSRSSSSTIAMAPSSSGGAEPGTSAGSSGVDQSGGRGGVGGGEWSERFFFLSGHFLRYKKRSLNLTSVNLKQVSKRVAPKKNIVVVVIVVFFTLTDRASTIPSNIRGCQSGTWSQRGTKVNGSHHGDNPLLGPTGIQIATKSYATLQAMAPTNNKTVHQTSFTPYREQPRSTRTCDILLRSLLLIRY